MARLDTKNTTKYWWDRHISGLSLMHADFTSHDYAPHTHDAFVIAVTELGGARIKKSGGYRGCALVSTVCVQSGGAAILLDGRQSALALPVDVSHSSVDRRRRTGTWH
jgi:hypothetical protein